ncbi:MAG: beta-carotene 15,15'-dioxygenase, Brp/Blh family [Rhodothermales bacterium]|nr:beta-carotene 15,15'-dioxygenase, Brp/Blh family [Rhodothermales bacterium]
MNSSTSSTVPVYLRQRHSSTSNKSVIRRIVVWPAWAIIVSLVVASDAVSDFPEWLMYVPFVASFILFGLPHGAVDHLVLIRLRGQKANSSSVVRAILPYLALAIGYLLVWWTVPAAAFLFFIAITWFHWGQGDLHSILVLGKARHLSSRLLRVMSIVIRGGLPMLIPLLAFPEIYRGVAQSIVGLIRPDAIVHLEWLFADRVLAAAGLGFALLVTVYFLSSLSGENGARRSWLEDVAEVLLLSAFFSVVHPVLAVGVYFCLWHATRHITRILLVDGRQLTTTACFVSGVRQFYRDSAPTTSAALVLMMLLYFAAPYTPTNLQEWTALYLVLIAVLTLPHVWVVSRMDRAERIWARG